MKQTLIRTQAEFDAAVTRGTAPIALAPDADITVTQGEPDVLVTSGSPRVEARESSQPRVEAWESSQPRVEARGSVLLAVSGKVTVEATEHVATLIEGALAEVSGGIQRRLLITTPAAWCDYYGARVENGEAILFKAVNDDLRSSYGFQYPIGKAITAPDWDGGKQECGRGLHFCAHVGAAKGYYSEATRFVACAVRLDQMRAPRPDATNPNKIKAKGCRVLYEVDEDGEPIAAPATVAKTAA